MALDDATIRKAKETPIAEVWSRLGFEEPPGRDRHISSPFREDKNPSLTVGHGGHNIVHDWATKDTWDTIGLVRKVKALDFVEAVEWILGEQASGNGRHSIKPPRQTPKEVESDAHKMWPRIEDALAEMEQLALAKDSPSSQRFFKEEYGLDPDYIPSDWRLLKVPQKYLPVKFRSKYPDGAFGVCYIGSDPYDRICAVKWKSFDRPEKGKRIITYLSGSGGAIVRFGDHEDIPMVVVAGEEKAAAAIAAGFGVLSSLTGEPANGIGDDWIEYLKRRSKWLVLANDNDETGIGSNEKSADKLERSGFPGVGIFLADWQDPAINDLNDLAKAGGIAAVHEFLDSPKPHTSKMPRLTSWGRFVSAHADNLAFIIEGILPVDGKVTVSSAAKAGKSLWAMQVGCAIASGNCEFLGMKFKEPRRLLYFQAEIKDPLLADRIRWMSKDIPTTMSRERIDENFVIQEIGQWRPDFYSPEGRQQAEALIRIAEPKVIVLDPLAMVCPGLAENQIDKMIPALRYFDSLSDRYGVAIILIHHFGKTTGYARGVGFEGWGDTDIQFGQTKSDPTVAEVTYLCRCSSAESYPRYWKLHSRETPWFKEMPPHFIPGGGDKGKKHFQHILQAFRVAFMSGATVMSPGDLYDAVAGLANVSPQTIRKRVVPMAVSEGLIKNVNGLFMLTKDLPDVVWPDPETPQETPDEPPEEDGFGEQQEIPF